MSCYILISLLKNTKKDKHQSIKKMAVSDNDDIFSQEKTKVVSLVVCIVSTLQHERWYILLSKINLTYRPFFNKPNRFRPKAKPALRQFNLLLYYSTSNLHSPKTEFIWSWNKCLTVISEKTPFLNWWLWHQDRIVFYLHIRS